LIVYFDLLLDLRDLLPTEQLTLNFTLQTEEGGLSVDMPHSHDIWVVDGKSGLSAIPFLPDFTSILFFSAQCLEEIELAPPSNITYSQLVFLT